MARGCIIAPKKKGLPLRGSPPSVSTFLRDLTGYRALRLASTLVADVTGGAIVICGPCTFGSLPAPCFSAILALLESIKCCYTCLSALAMESWRDLSPPALVCPASFAFPEAG